VASIAGALDELLPSHRQPQPALVAVPSLRVLSGTTTSYNISRLRALRPCLRQRIRQRKEEQSAMLCWDPQKEVGRAMAGPTLGRSWWLLFMCTALPKGTNTTEVLASPSSIVQLPLNNLVHRLYQFNILEKSKTKQSTTQEPLKMQFNILALAVSAFAVSVSAAE